MKESKLKKEYFNIFKSNLLLLETVSDNIERLLEDFDKTFEYMQNTDNDLQEYFQPEIYRTLYYLLSLFSAYSLFILAIYALSSLTCLGLRSLTSPLLSPSSVIVAC